MQATIWWLPIVVGIGFVVIDIVVIMCLMLADPFLIFGGFPFALLTVGLPAAFTAASVATKFLTKRLSKVGTTVLVLVALSLAALNYGFVAACAASV